MLENWLKPIKIDANTKTYLPFQLGSTIKKFEKKMPSLKETQLALLGVGKSSDTIRHSLYSLSCSFSELKIVDLGNFRKNTVDFMIPAIEELIKSNIIPILIGDFTFFSNASYKAFNRLLHHVSLIVVDRQVTMPDDKNPDPKNYLEEILLQQGEKTLSFIPHWLPGTCHRSSPISLFR